MPDKPRRQTSESPVPLFLPFLSTLPLYSVYSTAVVPCGVTDNTHQFDSPVASNENITRNRLLFLYPNTRTLACVARQPLMRRRKIGGAFTRIQTRSGKENYEYRRSVADMVNRHLACS